MLTETTSPLWSLLTGQNPQAIAIWEANTPYTRQALLTQVQQAAGALQAQGVKPGDRVALAFGNQLAFIVAFLAIWQLGAVVVPLNLQWPDADTAYVLTHAGVVCVVAAAPMAQKLTSAGLPLPVLSSQPEQTPEAPMGTWEAALAQATPATHLTPKDPHAMAVLMYTSGTTGQPKGVMLSETNLAANLQGIRQVLHFNQQDLVLMALPLFHAFGLILTLYGLMAQTPLLLVPRWTPSSLGQALLQHPVTVLPLVPTLFGLLVQGLKGQKPSKLKYCISGGAALPQTLLHHVEAALGCPVLEGYGLTETSPVIAVNTPAMGSCAGSVGPVLYNVQLQLQNEQGQPLPVTQGIASATGEICIKAPSVMLGYYQQPEATQATFTEDGWLKTGDLGHVDAEGRLCISGGRIKDLIIKAGENLSPVRIETVLYQHPEVKEACVFGVADDRVGEEVMAAVALNPPLADLPTTQVIAALKTHCLSLLPAAMVPKQIMVLETLPKNGVGKIVKNQVKALWQQQAQAATATP
jgi:long-chain acyl-CoA synthetase